MSGPVRKRSDWYARREGGYCRAMIVPKPRPGTGWEMVAGQQVDPHAPRRCKRFAVENGLCRQHLAMVTGGSNA